MLLLLLLAGNPGINSCSHFSFNSGVESLIRLPWTVRQHRCSPRLLGNNSRRIRRRCVRPHHDLVFLHTTSQRGTHKPDAASPDESPSCRSKQDEERFACRGRTESHYGNLETSSPLRTDELVPGPRKAAPGSAVPRRAHSHKPPA